MPVMKMKSGVAAINSRMSLPRVDVSGWLSGRAE
jgi:hypothetical protein